MNIWDITNIEFTTNYIIVTIQRLTTRKGKIIQSGISANLFINRESSKYLEEEFKRAEATKIAGTIEEYFNPDEDIPNVTLAFVMHKACSYEAPIPCEILPPN